jgi:hypothetical protein
VLDSLSRNAFTLHLKLANEIRFDIWHIVDSNIALKAEKEGRATRNRHEGKLN